MAIGRNIKRVGAAVVTLTAGAAVAVGSGIGLAPVASAAPYMQPGTLTVSADGGVGIPPAGPYGTSCTYPVSVDTWADGGAVNFYARNGGGMWERVGIDNVGPGDAPAAAQWTPHNGPGLYQVAATADYGGDTAPYWESFTDPGDTVTFVMVGNGINLQSLCLVMP